MTWLYGTRTFLQYLGLAEVLFNSDLGIKVSCKACWHRIIFSVLDKGSSKYKWKIFGLIACKKIGD